MSETRFKSIKVERLPESEAVITGEITPEFLSELRPEALKALGERVNMPGFRKGKVPENVLVRELGEMSILEETAEVAIAKVYTDILDEAKIAPISRPQVSITKLAPGIPLEFKIKVYLEPEVELPDYKKIAEKINKEDGDKAEVTDKEVADLIEELKKRDINPQLAEGEKLEDKVRENILLEKGQQSKDKKRLKMVEELVKEMKVSLPKVLVDTELDRMVAQFKDDVSRMGAEWNQYLSRVNKTEEEIKGEWRPRAVDRVKAELVVSKIAEKEGIEPEADELEHETNHLLQHYPDADPMRARVYVYTHIRSQKVFQFLESLGETKKETKTEDKKEEKPKKPAKPAAKKKEK